MNYTAQSTEMEVGMSYPISIITAVGGNPYHGYSGDQLGIWIDWNEDEDFNDPNETICLLSGYGFFQSTIMPPGDTIPGTKRMRVRLMYTGTLSPCGITQYGEVEDYSIEVPQAEQCDIVEIGTGTSTLTYPMST
jgi:hypothetical protein